MSKISKAKQIELIERQLSKFETIEQKVLCVRTYYLRDKDFEEGARHVLYRLRGRRDEVEGSGIWIHCGSCLQPAFEVKKRAKPKFIGVTQPHRAISDDFIGMPENYDGLCSKCGFKCVTPSYSNIGPKHSPAMISSKKNGSMTLRPLNQGNAKELDWSAVFIWLVFGVICAGILVTAGSAFTRWWMM